MIPKLFHRRQLENAGMLPNTFKYELTERIKKQLELIISPIVCHSHSIFDIYSSLSEEFPEITEIPHHQYNWMGNNNPMIVMKSQFDQIMIFFHHSTTDISLSILEIMCIYHPEMIDSVNDRLQYEGFGYQYNKQSQCIIKIEDETFYEQCTIKTMGVLAREEYTDVLDHYRRAYDELAKKKYDDAFTSIGRSIESLIKTRLTNAEISYCKKDTAKRLLDITFSNIDKNALDYDLEKIKEHIFDSCRARNDAGAHGHSQGESPKVDDVFTRFIINQAAASLLFLAEVNIAAPRKMVL